MSTSTGLHPSFLHTEYVFRKKVFKIFGGVFHVYDRAGKVVLYSKQKAFKLREDFRVYPSETATQELLVIKTPQILDLGATYYVQDGMTHQPVGALRRRVLKSILRDHWDLLSNDGREIGTLTESSAGGALASRLIKLIPQSYVLRTTTGTEVATIQQQFNPFVLKYIMCIPEAQPPIDRRLLITAGILLAGIEGRQE